MPKYAEEILAAVTELQQHPKAEQVSLEIKGSIPASLWVRYICPHSGSRKRQSYGGEVS